ncbi:hypothetical protein ACH4TC_01495 [Streptomyces spororaveus]|uniref:hypothetical protein n=1 Tax=Streptomyces spororaveus TaxID=284039 RepID=UPI0037980E40
MLAANARCYRPDFDDHDRLVEFDPWNADFVQIWHANRRRRFRHILGQHGMRAAVKAVGSHTLFYVVREHQRRTGKDTAGSSTGFTLACWPSWSYMMSRRTGVA